MITTNGQLYQWDTHRVIKVCPVSNYKVDEIQIHNESVDPYALVLETWEENGNTYAKIPDTILQFDSNINIYAMMSNNMGKHTIEHKTLPIKWRAKPEEYVYTETELKTLESLLGGEANDNN